MLYTAISRQYTLRRRIERNYFGLSDFRVTIISIILRITDDISNSSFEPLDIDSSTEFITIDRAKIILPDVFFIDILNLRRDTSLSIFLESFHFTLPD